MGENGPECNVDRGCMSCGHCVAICPVGALDNKYTPRDLMITMPKMSLTEQQLYEYMRARRSVRLFKKEAPSKEDILKLLNICRYAPTAGNTQGMYFHIITDLNKIKAVADTTASWMEREVEMATENKRYFKAVMKVYRERKIDIITRSAPMLVFLSARRLNITGVSNAEQSMAYAEIFAPAIGLGTTIAGFVQSCGIAGWQPLLDLVGIPAKHKLVGCMMVGYPRVKYQRVPERQHLKFYLEIGKQKWPALWWDQGALYKSEFNDGELIDIAYNFQRNTFNGHEGRQLQIVDCRHSQ